MAVLKKHGAELLRLKKITSALDADLDWKTENIDERAYTSDGSILTKHAWRNAKTGRIEPGGWKLHSKVKPQLSPAQIAKMYEAKGWTVEMMTHLSPDRPIRQGPLDENARKFQTGLSDQTQFVF